MQNIAQFTFFKMLHKNKDAISQNICSRHFEIGEAFNETTFNLFANRVNECECGGVGETQNTMRNK